jgi:hypothetical protein
MYTRVDSSGQPIGLPANFPPEEGDGNDWRPLEMPPPRTSPNQILTYTLKEGKCVGKWVGDPDPNNRLATNDEITSKHKELEIAPIVIFGQLFDCDEKSEIRMRDAIKYWEYRPIEAGVFEERLVNNILVKGIIWTRGDNSFVFLTQEQLTAIYDEMLMQRALRGANLFAKARKFKDTGISFKELMDINSWLK